MRATEKNHIFGKRCENPSDRSENPSDGREKPSDRSEKPIHRCEKLPTERNVDTHLVPVATFRMMGAALTSTFIALAAKELRQSSDKAAMEQ